jgi:Tfp pilus assembly pilus retraction ATPase PilT
MAAEVIKASINGKLIVSTMHADTAVSAVSRIVSLASESGSGLGEKAARETLASGLVGVVYMARLPGNRRGATEYLLGSGETAGKIMSGEYKGLQNVVNNLRNRLNHGLPLFGN